MQLSLYANLHFKICGFGTVLSLQGLVILVCMSFLELVDVEQWFLTRGVENHCSNSSVNL